MVGDLRSCEISAITTVAHCRTVRARRSRADRLAPPPTFDTPFSRAAGVRYRRRFRRLLNVFIVHVTTRRRNRGCTTARTVLARWLHRQKSSLTPATTLAMVRVVIAEDSFVVRQGLVALLGTEADIEVVATAETFDEALAAALRHRPDVVLTDIRMPPTGTDEGIRLAATLRLHAPEIGVVVLSQHADPAYALELLAAGSERRSYLLKERIGDADQLIGALRTVVAGGSSVDPSIVDALLSARSDPRITELDRLTPRERDILAELATGRSNAAIADRLSLSERSVEKYINTLFAKLGLGDDSSLNRRVKAVLLYLSVGG